MNGLAPVQVGAPEHHAIDLASMGIAQRLHREAVQNSSGNRVECSPRLPGRPVDLRNCFRAKPLTRVSPEARVRVRISRCRGVFCELAKLGAVGYDISQRSGTSQVGALVVAIPRKGESRVAASLRLRRGG
jgi:hypothetical protein